MKVQLFTAETTNTSSAEFIHTKDHQPFNIYVSGTFGGATVVLEAEIPGGTDFVPVSNISNSISYTAPGMFTHTAAPFVGRLTITGGTGANISAWYETESKEVRRDVSQR